MINYEPIKSNGTRVFQCLVTMRAALKEKGSQKAADKVMNLSVGHRLAQPLKLNII